MYFTKKITTTMKILTFVVFLIIVGVCLAAKPVKKPDRNDKVDDEIAELEKLIQNIENLNPKELQKLQDRIDKNLAVLEDLSIDLKDFDDRAAARKAREAIPAENEDKNVIDALGPYLQIAQQIVNNAVDSINSFSKDVIGLLSNNGNAGKNPINQVENNLLADTNQNVLDFLNNLNVPNVPNVMELLGQVQQPNAAEFISNLSQNITDFVQNFNQQYNTDFTAASLPSVAEIANNLGNFNMTEFTNNLNLPKLPNLPRVTNLINRLNNIPTPRSSGLNQSNLRERVTSLRKNLVQRLSSIFASVAQENNLNNNIKDEPISNKDNTPKSAGN